MAGQPMENALSERSESKGSFARVTVRYGWAGEREPSKADVPLTGASLALLLIELWLASLTTL